MASLNLTAIQLMKRALHVLPAVPIIVLTIIIIGTTTSVIVSLVFKCNDLVVDTCL